MDKAAPTLLAAATLAMATLAAASVLMLAPLPAGADTIELPSPQSEQLGGSELLEALGAPRDRLPAASVPGRIVTDELVTVEVAGDASLVRVSDQQRIQLSGVGDYHIRESGPARLAAGLGDDHAGDQPVLDSGDIVWQGFCPGNRQLVAEFLLDPQIEAAHLPLRMRLSFTGADGRPTPLLPGLRVPGPGTVKLTVSNTTGQSSVLPTAVDGPASTIAAALDRTRSVARSRTSARLPTVRTVLPADLRVTGASSRPITQTVPLRLSGTLRLRGGGSGRAGGSGSVSIVALLRHGAEFRLASTGPATVELDLRAVPALDPARLGPPSGFGTWSAWAASKTTPGQRRTALDLLVRTAATGARASAYSPYLGPGMGPAGSTTFHYVLAAATNRAASTPALAPRPLPIALAVTAGLLLVTGAALVWRRS